MEAGIARVIVQSEKGMQEEMDDLPVLLTRYIRDDRTVPPSITEKSQDRVEDQEGEKGKDKAEGDQDIQDISPSRLHGGS